MNADVKNTYIPHIKALKESYDLYRKDKKDDEIFNVFNNSFFEVGKWISAFYITSYNCSDCGAELKPILTSKDTLSFITATDFHNLSKNFKIDIDEIPECSALKSSLVDKIVTEIDLPSGNLFITNYFKKKKIFEKKHSDLNSLLGRIDIANYLAKLNIGCGQMSNMSMSIWVNKNKEEILFTDISSYDEETDEETIFTYEGYDYLGTISLSIWRWMCGDIEVLKTHNEKIPNVKQEIQKDNTYVKYALAEVKPGKWVIEHYFDLVGYRNDGIFSRLYLK